MAKLTGRNALICGDSRTLELTFPFDITGCTVFFTVKSSSDLGGTDDNSALIEKTVTSHTDPTNGKTNIVLSNIDTRIDADKYVYDIQIKDSQGNISSIVPQDIEFVEDVTKRTS